MEVKDSQPLIPAQRANVCGRQVDSDGDGFIDLGELSNAKNDALGALGELAFDSHTQRGACTWHTCTQLFYT
jgi:hypothetical protein